MNEVRHGDTGGGDGDDFSFNCTKIEINFPAAALPPAAYTFHMQGH